MEYAAYHTPSSGPCQMRKRGEAGPVPSRGIRQEQHGSSPAAGGGQQGWGDFQTGMEIRLTAEGFCGILDTARNGRISEWRRPCPCVCPMASARLAWFDWRGPKMGQYRIQAAVSPRLPIGKRLSWAVVSPQPQKGRPDSQYAGLNPLFFQERLQALGFHHF